jgi:hypothetical protein
VQSSLIAAQRDGGTRTVIRNGNTTPAIHGLKEVLRSSLIAAVGSDGATLRFRGTDTRTAIHGLIFDKSEHASNERKS